MMTKRISILIGYFTALIFMCNACNSRDSRVQEAERLNEQIARKLMNLWETGDTTQVGDLFTTDAVYEDKADALVFNGIDGVKKYVGHVHAWASDVRMEIHGIQVSPTGATMEWTFSGVQTKPIGEIIPIATHNKFSFKGSTVIYTDNGKIAQAFDYIDVLNFLLQIGAKLELPGGVTLSTPLYGPGTKN